MQHSIVQQTPELKTTQIEQLKQTCLQNMQAISDLYAKVQNNNNMIHSMQVNEWPAKVGPKINNLLPLNKASFIPVNGVNIT